MKWQIRLLQSYFYALTKKQHPPVRFIYFAHSRSGSHLFADLLNSHPDIVCVTESRLFLRRDGIRFPYHFIDGVSKLTSTPVFGGKVSVSHLERQQGSPSQIVERLHAAGWKFIVLQRENILKQSISNQLARKRWQFNETVTPTVDQLQIEIDIATLHANMQKRIGLNQRTAKLLEPYQPLHVCYERNLIGAENQQATANRVFEFLGVSATLVQTRLAKSGVYVLTDYITNYEEMIASLKGTPYERYLSMVDEAS